MLSRGKIHAGGMFFRPGDNPCTCGRTQYVYGRMCIIETVDIKVYINTKTAFGRLFYWRERRMLFSLEELQVAILCL